MNNTLHRRRLDSTRLDSLAILPSRSNIPPSPSCLDTYSSSAPRNLVYAPRPHTTPHTPRTHQAPRDVQPAMSIKPLPGHVVAQIKSSVVITSLNNVTCGLVRNSLDAHATKINVTIDYSRGNCSVEDNGDGIPPSDFDEGGGLGQLHCTSSARPALLDRTPADEVLRYQKTRPSSHRILTPTGGMAHSWRPLRLCRCSPSRLTTGTFTPTIP